MTTTSDWSASNTDHGLLVAFGEFLQQHGLLQRLMQVPVEQKTVCFAPASKLIEFLAGIMGGMEYVSDLNDGPHPLAKDSVVAHAWGQEVFAHYSSISRTLAACDDETLSAVQQAVEMFSQPFIRTAVHALLQAGSAVVFDLDLMGQPVSATSTSYPDVAFGWMNERVQFGYQVARICFTTRAHERLWLSGFHPVPHGEAVSAALRAAAQDSSSGRYGFGQWSTRTDSRRRSTDESATSSAHGVGARAHLSPGPTDATPTATAGPTARQASPPATDAYTSTRANLPGCTGSENAYFSG